VSFALIITYRKYNNPFIKSHIYKVIFTWFYSVIRKVNEKIEDEKLLKQLGARIRDLRKKAGYTSQETFAYEAGIPRSLYGTYEAGANITILNLKKIISFHKITFEQFFSEGFN
jgi:hypothetical protein